MNNIKFGLKLGSVDNINYDEINFGNLNINDVFSELLKNFQTFYDNIGSKRISDLYRARFSGESNTDYENYISYEKLGNSFVSIIKNPEYANEFLKFINNNSDMFNLFMDNLKRDYDMLKDDVFNYQSDYFLIKLLCTDCEFFLRQLFKIQSFSSFFMTDLIYKHAGLNDNDAIFRDLPLDKKYLVSYLDFYSRSLNNIIENNFDGVLSDSAVNEIKNFFSNPFFQRDRDRYQLVFVDYIKTMVKNKNNESFCENFSNFIVGIFGDDYIRDKSINKLNGISYAMNFSNKYPNIFKEMMNSDVIYTSDIKEKIYYMISVPLSFDINSYDEFVNVSLNELKRTRYLLKRGAVNSFKRNVTKGDSYVIFNYDREIIRLDVNGDIRSVNSPYSHNDDIREMYYFIFKDLRDSEDASSIIYRANVELGDIVLLTENTSLLIYLPPLDYLNKNNVGRLFEMVDSLRDKEDKINIGCGIASINDLKQYYYFNDGGDVKMEQLELFLNGVLKEKEVKK